MKKNRSQMIFFILCVITAAALAFFLYTYRQKEHDYTARLKQEAMSEETDSLSLNATDPSASINGEGVQDGTVSENGDTQNNTDADVIPADSAPENPELSPNAAETEEGQPEA